MVPGHMSDYHRIFSRAAWVLWPLAKVLSTFVVALAEEHAVEGWILVAGDDTVAQAKGKRVYGKGCHHDSVRRSHSHTVWRWGHRWGVLAVIMMGTFMAILDSSIVNVALPHMMSTYGVNRDQIEWVSTGFMLASAAVMPLMTMLS